MTWLLLLTKIFTYIFCHALSEYDINASQGYKLLPCYDNFVITGPESLFTRPMEEDSDEETIVDESASEDHYALLVKAWEQKVFPVIRRRFRNEAERKDGLEQIRGALQLGKGCLLSPVL